MGIGGTLFLEEDDFDSGVFGAVEANAFTDFLESETVIEVLGAQVMHETVETDFIKTGVVHLVNKVFEHTGTDFVTTEGFINTNINEIHVLFFDDFVNDQFDVIVDCKIIVVVDFFEFRIIVI